MRSILILSMIFILLSSYVYSEESMPGSLKKEEQSVDISSVLAWDCPRMARQAINDFKRGPIKNKDSLIPFFEKSFSEQFEPVKCFFNSPSNSVLFSKAWNFATANRDYDLARAIIEKTPQSYVKITAPNIKELLMGSVAVSEKNEVGSILFSNRMVKVYGTFPSMAQSFTNPPRTFYVEWEEQLNYSNKLYLVNIASGRRVQSLKNLVDAYVLWSNSGRYIAVQWRTFQWMRESEALGNRKSMHVDSKEPYENIPSGRYQIAIIDTLISNKITQLDDFLPELARQSTRMDYTIEKWENDGTVLISASWLEGAEVVNKCFHVTLETDGKLKMRIEKE